MNDLNKDIEIIDERDPRAYMWSKYKRYPYILAKFTLVGACLFIVGYLLRTIESVLFPLFISILIAYLLDPLVYWFEKKKVSRTVAIMIIILSLIVALALFTLVLYPTFERSVGVIGQKIPNMGHAIFDDFFPWVEDNLGFKLPDSISATLKQYRTEIEQQIPNIIQRASSAITDLATRSQAILTSLVNMVMIPVFSFYFLRDFASIRSRFLSLVPKNNNNEIMKRLEKMDTVVGAWFRGQLTVSAILAGLYSIGLGIVFGVSGIGITGGIGVGILTGFLNIIPYFGVTTGFVMSVLMVLIDWNGVWPLIGVGIVFLIVQLLEGYYITPKIVGNAVGLSPVVVIIVLLIGGATFGLIGVLIATPIAGIVKVLLPDLLDYYRRSSFYTGKYVAAPYTEVTSYRGHSLPDSKRKRTPLDLDEDEHLIIRTDYRLDKKQDGDDEEEEDEEEIRSRVNDVKRAAESRDRDDEDDEKGDKREESSIIVDSSILDSDDPKMKRMQSKLNSDHDDPDD